MDSACLDPCVGGEYLGGGVGETRTGIIYGGANRESLRGCYKVGLAWRYLSDCLTTGIPTSCLLLEQA